MSAKNEHIVSDDVDGQVTLVGEQDIKQFAARVDCQNREAESPQWNGVHAKARAEINGESTSRTTYAESLNLSGALLER